MNELFSKLAADAADVEGRTKMPDGTESDAPHHKVGWNTGAEAEAADLRAIAAALPELESALLKSLESSLPPDAIADAYRRLAETYPDHPRYAEWKRRAEGN